MDRHHSISVDTKNPEKVVPGINMAPTAAGYNQKIKIFSASSNFINHGAATPKKF